MEHHGKHTHQIRPTLPTRLYVSATAQGNLVCLTRQMKQFSVPDAQIAGIRESPEFGQGLIKGSRGSSVQNHRLNASELQLLSGAQQAEVRTQVGTIFYINKI